MYPVESTVIIVETIALNAIFKSWHSQRLFSTLILQCQSFKYRPYNVPKQMVVQELGIEQILAETCSIYPN